MNPILFVHMANSISCLCIGLPFNFLLLFFICRQTEKEMRAYSRLLLQTCVADILLLVMQGGLQHMYLVVDGWDFLIMNGPIRHFDSPVLGNICYAVWNFLFYFSVIGLAAQFVYRYFVLCWQIKSENALYFAILAVVIFIDASLFAFMELIFYTQQHPIYLTNPQALAILNAGSNGENMQKWIVVAFTNNGDPTNQLWLVAYWAICLLGYLVIFASGMKIREFIGKNFKGAANKNKLRIQREISRTLLLQAIIPGMILLSILFGAPLSYLSDGTNSTLLSIEMLLSAPLNWLPLLNSMVTIWTIKAYRNSFCRIFCRQQIEMNSEIGNISAKNSAGIFPITTNNVLKKKSNNWVSN